MADNNIVGAELTMSLDAAKILVMQGLAGKAPRINLTNYHWEVYDNDTQAWVDTGVNAHGQDAYSPYISDSGYWYVWDDQGQEYVNTNVKAQGPQGDPGYSPEVTVESIQGGHTVTITDEEHPQGQSFNVMNGFGGISEDVKVALLNCFEHVAWVDADGQDYYDALEAALYPPKTLVSISAAFNQGSAVIYDTDSLDSLKPYLTVTAHYDDSSTGVVTNYTLSGTLTVGTSTITVLYSGKTTTFTVNVTAPAALVSISAVFTQGSAVIYDTDSLDSLKQYLVVTATMTDSTTRTVTDYTLSGTLSEGTSVITVSYGGKTTTFNVAVTAAPLSDVVYVAGAVAKDTNPRGCYATAVAARARMEEPIENDGYVFTVTDSTKYALCAQDITSLQYTTNPTVGNVYPAGTKTAAWVDSDSVSTAYVWLMLKKNDGTEFTDEELANGAAAVVTVTQGT